MILIFAKLRGMCRKGSQQQRVTTMELALFLKVMFGTEFLVETML